MTFRPLILAAAIAPVLGFGAVDVGFPVDDAAVRQPDHRVVNDLASMPASTTATYRLTFESTWSAQTHPDDFPPNPHFSGLIGATHGPQTTFWAESALASDGIESMAETGSKFLLQGEVNTAITGGTAEFLVSGGGIAVSPGSVSVTFDISSDYPLVTVVSMLAPSPDWFVGVAGLELMSAGSWLQEVTVPLTLHDAGTDSGVSYRSPNSDTDPPALITQLTDPPFNGGNVVGTFTFTLQSGVANEPTVVAPDFEVSQVYPNPAATSFEIAIQPDRSQSLRAALFDVSGRRVRAFDLGWVDAGGGIVLEVDIGGLSEQVYFVRVAGSSFVVVRPVVVRR